jgi:hypothetical protein
LKIIRNSNRAEGPLVSCTGRLTAPNGHPVPYASATVPVTTGGRPLPRLAMLHLWVAAPRVGFILPCRSSWRSRPFLPPSRSPRSTSRLFSACSYAIVEPQDQVTRRPVLHPRPNRCVARRVRSSELVRWSCHPRHRFGLIPEPPEAAPARPLSPQAPPPIRVAHRTLQ